MAIHTLANGKQKKVLYRSIVDGIKQQIDDHQFLPGERLPSIVALAEEQNVSHITIRAAIAELMKMGYVTSRPRSGIYVSHESARQPKSMRHPVTERAQFAGSSPDRPLAGTVIGMIAVAPSYDPTDPNRWAYFNQLHITILRGAEQSVGEAGGTARYIGIADWRRIPSDFPLAVQAHADAGASAIIVVDIHNLMADEVMRLVGKAGPPLIYISSGETCTPPYHVYTDNKAAGLMAGRHLLSQGYNDIAFIGPVDNIWVDERSEGVSKAVEAVGAGVRFTEFPAKQDRLADNPVHDPILCAKRELIVASLARLTGWPGIVAANDDAAMIVHEIQSSKGLQAGRDYGLVGFDDEPQIRSLGITSIYPAVASLGNQAAHLAVQVLHGQISNAIIRLPPMLLPRESTLARGE